MSQNSTRILRLFALAVWLLAASWLFASPPLPSIPSGSFDITAYGALGDGVTDNTAAVQAALNAARTAGGGTVRVPSAARAFACGPITIYSNTRLQVDSGATLLALPFSSYPRSTSSPSNFISIPSGVSHVALTGSGTIDGNGAAWWAAYSSGTITNRPRLVYFTHADTILVSGLTLINSPTFHLAFNTTNNVTIDGVTITAPLGCTQLRCDRSGGHALSDPKLFALGG